MDNNIDPQVLFKKIFDLLKEKLGENFLYLITSGSSGIDKMTPGWSDIDFIAVLNIADIRSKIIFNGILKEIEKTTGIGAGGLIVEASDIKKKNFLRVADGKTIQSFLEQQLGIQKVYSNISDKPFAISMADKDIKEFSLAEFRSVFCLYRRSVIRGELNNESSLKKIVDKGVHYVLISSKLYIQYISGITCSGEDQILKEVAEYLPKEMALQLEKIAKLKSEDRTEKDFFIESLSLIDNYMEDLKKYIYEKE